MSEKIKNTILQENLWKDLKRQYLILTCVLITIIVIGICYGASKNSDILLYLSTINWLKLTFIIAIMYLGITVLCYIDTCIENYYKEEND